MDTEPALGERVSGRRLAALLGRWRQGGRTGASDLAGAVRLLALDGRLTAGARLPAERELAGALGVSRTLVGAALERLRADGVVASRRGSGSWILPPAGGHPHEPPPASELIDLARAVPEPLPGIAAAVDAARARLVEQLATDGYREYGLPALRERIARHYTARGLPTSVAQVLVSNGAHAAFVLALAVLTAPGDRVVVEHPSYPNALDAIRGARANPVPVAMTADGWNVPALEAALRQAAPGLAYLIPDFQNPTGHRMDHATRTRVGALLRRTRTFAVVDETLLELDYTAEAPPPLAAFAPEQVITVGSASKSHWGGLRLGWIRASAELVERLAHGRFAVDLGSPVLEQLVLAELLATGGDALDQRRTRFAARRDTLAAELRRNCPQWTFTVPGGGLSLWCRLDRPVSTRLAIAAENHGLRLAPGARFGAHGGLERMLRVPFTLPPPQLAEAARRLGLVAAAVRPPRDGGVAVTVL